MNRDRHADAFRRWGHLQADLDSLGRLAPSRTRARRRARDPEAPTGGRSTAARSARSSCTSPIRIGAGSSRRRMEAEPPARDRRPDPASGSRKSSCSRGSCTREYVGTKRYSSRAPRPSCRCSTRALEAGVGAGARARAHRDEPPRAARRHDARGGRSTGPGLRGVWRRRPAKRARAAATSSTTSGPPGSYDARGGATIAIHLVSNPSHLEAVDPVLMGRAPRRQTRLGDDGAKARPPDRRCTATRRSPGRGSPRRR